MAPRKPTSYKVVGVVAVVRSGKTERYLYRGAEVAIDAIDDDNAKHLLGAKLIEPVFAAEKSTSSDDDAAAKAKAEADKKAAEAAAAKQTPPAS